MVTVRVIAASGTSWLGVKGSGGKQMYAGLLKQGQSQDFTDKKHLKVALGNAGAVRLVVNGKDLGTPGEDGAVRHFDFGPGDPQAAG
jgi:cytoskeleton protein RodZ